MVNIINEDLWNAEPALRPEDEILLRRLHDMLQSTANDLKELSGELSQYHKKDVHIHKSLPMPLDEEFTKKVHIEEVVNAKFHGQKIVPDKDKKSTPNIKKIIDETFIKTHIKNPVVNHVVQANTVPKFKPKQLRRSRTRILEIKEESKNSKSDKVSLEKSKAESVSYNEFSYKYDTKSAESPRQSLQVQQLPSINIRSELTEQKVLNLNIRPESKTKTESCDTNNVAVIEVNHEIANEEKSQSIASNIHTKYHQQIQNTNKPKVKKISMMSTSESSESSNNISSDHQHRLKMKSKSNIKTSPKTSERHTAKKISTMKTNSESKRINFDLEKWKKKLNAVYSQSSKKSKSSLLSKSSLKKPLPKSKVSQDSSKDKPKSQNISSDTYIPYSHLTLGGVRVSDIEREITDDALKGDVPLSPILDKILTSRDNSFHIDSPKKRKNKVSEILNTSDENLLQEVLDIEKNINKTFSKYKKEKNVVVVPPVELPKEESETSKNSKEDDSYGDEDFEEIEKSGDSSVNQELENDSNNENDESKSLPVDVVDDDGNDSDSDRNIQNTNFIKTSNLSIKDSVDIFEFIHSIDTQDNATQSQTPHIISPKETQTSPRNDNANTQPIHNNLCPSIDPTGEVEKMFKLEKDFIKKLIAEEYADILEEKLSKPSSSKSGNNVEEKNFNASQKNTQTSPNHVKSVMTSPTRTKTRTTSPFTLNLTIDHQTSPLIFINDKELNLDETGTDKSNAEDLGISINLSSPRFSLRLPQTSREVISNLENASRRSSTPKKVGKQKEFKAPVTKIISSSTEDEVSSSEISSLGEVKLLKLKRRLTRYRLVSELEFSSCNTTSESSSDVNLYNILPLRSEGEISLKQINKSKTKDNTKL